MLSFFAADFSWQLAETAFVQLEALVLTIPIFRLLLDQERRPRHEVIGRCGISIKYSTSPERRGEALWKLGCSSCRYIGSVSTGAVSVFRVFIQAYAVF